MQLVAVSRAFQPANKFFGTDWTARFWIRCSNLNAQAQIVLFFEDDQGNPHPNIENNPGTGKISSAAAVVNGIGTVFLTELQVGDMILANDQVHRVVSISSNNNLIVDEAFNPNITNEEFIFQKFTILDPSLAPKAFGDAVVVETVARDFGRFEALDVKLIFNDVNEGDVIDIAEPFLTNEIGKSLHLDDNTIPRNKQREYKLYRMAVANPDVFTEVEAGLVGANNRIDSELVSLSGVAFTPLKNPNLFPFSEVVTRAGLKSSGTIQYSGQPADGDTITIGFVVFEFDNDSIVGVGHVVVTIGGTEDDTFQALVDQINTNSPLAKASLNMDRHTVTVSALLPGADGNGILFAQDCSVVKLTPIIGTLDGGVDGAQYTRGIDYTIRYDEGEIARIVNSSIPDPTPPDFAVTYSFFPGDVPLNTSYSQTIKPVGVKLEIDPTCLFFFRGRFHDFTDPLSANVNFEAVERSPSRFSYLKPIVRGKYAQVIHFDPLPGPLFPRDATLDFNAMTFTDVGAPLGISNQDAILVKTDTSGNRTSIPQDANGWFFVDETHIRLSAGMAHLLPSGETFLWDPEAEYEFVYFVKFQFTTAPINIADTSSAYALLPYTYKSRQVEEEKEDIEQTLFLNTNRQATLKLPAIQDQSLAELSRSFAGQTEVLTDDVWQFVDQNTVEVFLNGFDPAAIYSLTYKSSKISFVAP